MTHNYAANNSTKSEKRSLFGGIKAEYWVAAMAFLVVGLGAITGEKLYPSHNIWQTESQASGCAYNTQYNCENACSSGYQCAWTSGTCYQSNYACGSGGNPPDAGSCPSGTTAGGFDHCYNNHAVCDCLSGGSPVSTYSCTSYDYKCGGGGGPSPTPNPCVTTCQNVTECRQASNCSGSKGSSCGYDIYKNLKYNCTYQQCTTVCAPTATIPPFIPSVTVPPPSPTVFVPSLTPTKAPTRTPTPATISGTCTSYGIDENSGTDSQLVRISSTFGISLVKTYLCSSGPCDFESIASRNGVLYGVGNSKHTFYKMNKTDGTLSAPLLLSPQLYITGLSFKADGSLWAWAPGNGLYLLNPLTGTLSLQYATTFGTVDGIAWNSTGTLLYMSRGTNLFVYNPSTRTIATVGALGGETDDIGFAPAGYLNGYLVGSYKGSTSTEIIFFTYDVINKRVVSRYTRTSSHINMDALTMCTN